MDRSMMPAPSHVPQPFAPPAAATRIALGMPSGPPAKTTADYLRAVRKRAWLVLAIALLVIPPGAIQVLKQPDRYRVFARIRLEPPHFDERVATILPHSGVGQASRESEEKYVPNQMAELKNPALAEMVASNPELNLSPGEIAEAVALLASIQTRQHPNSNTFDVILEGRDRAKITVLLNGLLEEFKREAKETSTAGITKSQELASRSLKDLREELKDLDERLQRMMQEGTSLLGAGGHSLPEDQYHTLNSLLASRRAQYDQLAQQARMNQFMARSGLGTNLGGPYAQALADLKEQKERLEGYMEQHRRTIRRYATDPAARNIAQMYQETLTEMERLQRLSMKTAGDWTTPMLKQYGEEVRRLEGEVKKQLSQVQQTMPQYMAYLSLQREREQKQQNLVTMQDRLNAFDLLAATANDPVVVKLHAEEPTEPTGPNRKLQLGLVVFVGLGLGLGLVCLLESLDQRIRLPEQLVAGVTLPLYGVVPRMRRVGAMLRGGHFWTPGLPRSVEADSFRNIRASLLAATAPTGRPIVTLLVTSPKAGEGRTTTALNLAATCARCGERTLLLDANLRRPTLSSVFEPDHEFGLVDVLKGDLPWQRAVVRTEIPTLDFLPAGDPSDVPLEILGTLELVQLLKGLSGHYHRVIIDGPAVLGMADCRMLGRVADAAILVVRSGTQSLAPVQRAKEMLDQSRVNLIGIVFNGLDEDLENWGGLVANLETPALMARREGRGAGEIEVVSGAGA